MRKRVSQKRRAAYHEAAHAVAALRFGVDCHGAHIIQHGEHGEYGGSTGGEGMWHDLKSAREWLIIHYAGYCAVVKLDPDDEAQSRYGASRDFEDAERTLRAIGDTDEEAWISRAREFVETNWEPITLIAHELLEHKQLDCTELEFLINIADGKDKRATLVTYRANRAAALGET